MCLCIYGHLCMNVCICMNVCMHDCICLSSFWGIYADLWYRQRNRFSKCRQVLRIRGLMCLRVPVGPGSDRPVALRVAKCGARGGVVSIAIFPIRATSSTAVKQ